ncbi:MAG: glycoside hydrolase family 18 protein [Carboxylicivirga sp.]|jgi:GH18 family chitinase|nr:glycoside hydrolase family 18 protein [Carboxylicivirga sp.]
MNIQFQIIKRLALLVLLPVSIMTCQLKPKFQQKVVAYQKYNTIDTFNPEVYRYIDQLIYKLITVNARGDLQLRSSTLNDLHLLKAANPRNNGVKLLIGVGGAKANSQHFSEMTANDNSRKMFVRNLLDFCLKHDLDGADIDWEYPKSMADKDRAIKLFKELHIAFEQNDLILTAAINYAPDQVRLAKDIEKYVDQIHLMAYEPMEGIETYQEQLDYALRLAKVNRLNTEKLVMGLPFYGKRRMDGKIMTYKKIKQLIDEGPSIKAEFDFMDVDDIKTNVVELKENKISGIMFWELGFDKSLDSSQSLVRTIDINRSKN